jgi:UDP-N-acetylglucosamine--N-acetylmuramyl-(pentapeptide) pyrophosphoryl-undecaprenol N-acetylglucosamine transferase
MKKRIALAGGGTGGHLIPLASVAKAIKDGGKIDAEFAYFGPSGELESEIMGDLGIPCHMVISGKLRRYFSFEYLLDIFKFPIGLFQALWHLFRFMPDLVFAKGGYASVPVAIVARIYRIPVVIHESDAAAGLANKFLGSIASRVCIAFDRAKINFPPGKTVMTGNPINKKVLNGNRQKAMDFLGLKNLDRPVVLILGGSQGAKNINDAIISILPKLLEKFIVIHQVGKKNIDQVMAILEEEKIKSKETGYFPLGFASDEIGDLYALSDMVITRAGATSIAEVAANKKPAILVPITNSANDHQRINAYEVAKAGGAEVLEENNFTENMILSNLKQIFNDEVFQSKLIDNISKFYQQDADQKIAEQIISLI